MSLDFRQIHSAADSERADRLFRASISAFCSLTRPSRREIAQIDDLTIPLLPLASTASKRYVSAALSECRHVPPTLVHLLAEEPVAVSAPLLVRSSSLSDVDLIALIGRHGLPHARAIARRADLNPTIASLIKALEAQQSGDAGSFQSATPGGKAESVREQLRAIMRNEEDAKDDDSTPCERLRTAALSGVNGLFANALAKEFGIPIESARRVLLSQEQRQIANLLRTADLSAEEAYLIVSAVYPQHFPDTQAIRRFVEEYELIEPEHAAQFLRGLTARTAAPLRLLSRE